MAPAAVIGLLEDDRQAQLLAAGPALRLRTFFCSRLKKDSMAALSPAAPTRPIEPTMWWRLSWWTSFLDLN